MRKTTNYGLTLYEPEDKMIITAEENSLNANMEAIDKTLKEKANVSTIPTKVSDLENDSKFVTESFVTNKIAEAELSGGEVDLSGLATKDELNNKVDKVKGKSLIDDTEIERLKTVTNYDDTELKNNLNNKADKTSIPSKMSQLENDKNYITSIPSEYITETELNNKGYLTEHQDLSNYAKTTDIPTKVSQLTNDKNYLTSVPSGYVTETELNNKGYLTEITEEDKTEIAQMVIESLGGNPVFGYVDENNNIIVSGNLPDGDYTVMYEMEEGDTINIGNLVLDNTVNYSIINTLTNCTNSNNSATIVESVSYSATITANSGYELKSVSVTMGGSAVSVSGGNINISSVTGDIVITAVAEEKVVTPTYTNLANPSDANWKEGKRLNSSYNEVDAEGIVTTNFIPASKSTDSSNPTKIYVKGLTFGNSSNERVCQYIDQSTPNNAIVSTVNTDLFSRSGDVTIITLSGSAVMANSTLVRICGTLTGTSEDVIITVNEEIA